MRSTLAGLSNCQTTRVELARLASKQATRKQQASTAGPFLVRRAEREGVPKSNKKVTTPSGITFRNFPGNTFFCGPAPRWSPRVIYWGFGPFWAAGTGRNSGPGSKTEKHDFPDPGALLGEKTVRPQIFSQKSCNCFAFCVLADWTPQGREIAKYGFLGPFGLGQPLGI